MRVRSETDRYGLARHQLTNTLLDSIYTWEPVRRFVGDLLDHDQIYLHEDPSNALVVQIKLDAATRRTFFGPTAPDQSGVRKHRVTRFSVASGGP